MSFLEDFTPALQTPHAATGPSEASPGREREECVVQRHAPDREAASGDLASLVSVSLPRTRLSDLVLPDAHIASLELMLNEQRARARLAIHALRPTRRVLLVGPSGTGRAMTASALAAELNLPLFTVQIADITPGTGAQRARQLRLLAESMDRTRGVYLVDLTELGRRSSNECVAQLFLELEQFDADSPLVLLLDHASQLMDSVAERFELAIHFFRPSRSVIEQLIRKRLQRFDLRGVSLPQVISRAGDLNHAQINKACERAAKSAILRNSPQIEHTELLRAVDEERRRRRAR